MLHQKAKWRDGYAKRLEERGPVDYRLFLFCFSRGAMTTVVNATNAL
jgi:hypothetical protein